MSKSLVLRYNYLAFKVMTKLCLIPAVIDETGRMVRQQGRKQLVANHVVNGVWALRVVHSIVVAGYSAFFASDLHPLLRMVSYILATCGCLCLVSNFLMFHVYNDLTSLIFNEVARLQELNDSKSSWRKLSLVEFFVATFPAVVSTGFTMPCGVYFFLKRMPPVMLFSMWAEPLDEYPWAKVTVFVICLVGDVYTGEFIPMVANLFFYYVLMFTVTTIDGIKVGTGQMEMVEQQSKEQGQGQGQGHRQGSGQRQKTAGQHSTSETSQQGEGNKEAVIVNADANAKDIVVVDDQVNIGEMKLTLELEVDTAVKELRLIQLRMQLFNLGISTVIYLSKLLTLSTTVGAGFVAIKYASTHSLIAVLMTYLAGMSTLAYIALYNDSFKITDLMDQYKQEVLVNGQKLEGFQRNYVKKMIRSLPRMGVKCGPFNLMERESTPNYVDFAFQQIVDLLLTF